MPSSRRVLLLPLALACAAAALSLAPLAGAHGGVDDGDGQPKSALFAVTITSYHYSPDSIPGAAVGDEVKFTNRDKAIHQVLGPANVTSGDLKQDGVWTWKPTVPGNFTFYCKYHTRMFLKVAVKPAPPPNFAPEVEISEPADLAKVANSFVVKGTLKDTIGDGNILRLRFAGGDWSPIATANPWAARIDVSGYKDGIYLVEAAAQDTGGLYSKIAAVRVQVANGDIGGNNAGNGTSADGVISILSPAPGGEMRGSYVLQGVARKIDAIATKVVVRIDGGAWQNANGLASWRYALDTNNLTDGTHTIEASAFNGKVYSSVAVVRAFVANHDPNRITLKITSPASGDHVTSRVGIQGDLGGPRLDLAKVYVRVDGGPWSLADGVNPWASKWDAGAALPGAHYVEAIARAGAIESNVARINLVVDKVPSLPVNAQTAAKPEQAVPGLGVAFVIASFALVAVVLRRRDG